jgi:hypothetical protein
MDSMTSTEVAQTLNEKGNQAYRNKKFVLAAQRYNEALHVLDETTANLPSATFELKLDILSSRLQTRISQNIFTGNEDTELLKHIIFGYRCAHTVGRAKIVKALYRSSQMWKGKGDLEKASLMLRVCLGYDATNECILTAIKELTLLLEKRIELLAQASPFQNKTAEELEVDGEVCPTCLETFTLSVSVLKFQCRHYFHSECALRWFMAPSITCPVCRASVLGPWKDHSPQSVYHR